MPQQPSYNVPPVGGGAELTFIHEDGSGTSKEVERRAKHAIASTRFRQRKKNREKQQRDDVTFLQGEVRELQEKCKEFQVLLQELREVHDLLQVYGRDLHLQPRPVLPNPGQSNVQPSIGPRTDLND